MVMLDGDAVLPSEEFECSLLTKEHPRPCLQNCGTTLLLGTPPCPHKFCLGAEIGRFAGLTLSALAKFELVPPHSLITRGFFIFQ
jgi:hypothetical protein